MLHTDWCANWCANCDTCNLIFLKVSAETLHLHWNRNREVLGQAFHQQPAILCREFSNGIARNSGTVSSKLL
jgi:hypothetical protein